MDIRAHLRKYALGLEGAWLDPSWDMEGDVFKTAPGKIFLICQGAGLSTSVTLKLSPDDAVAALALPFVRPATWPRRWVTANIVTEAERDIVLDWVSRSHELVSAAGRVANRAH